MISSKEEALLAQIDKWLTEHRSQLIEDLCRLVRIPSISKKDEIPPYGETCRRALDEMLAIGREHGFQSQNYEYHCGALWLQDDPQEKTIGLWGHLDVVPEGGGWTYEPYEPVLRDGWLIGRGTQDNKGPAVADLYLIQCIRELGLPIRSNLRLYVGCDEENGMGDVCYFTAHYPCPDLSLITDSGFPVCYGEKGMLGLDLVSRSPLSGAVTALSGGWASNIVPDSASVTLNAAQPLCFQGTSKHTAFPEGGVNAIEKLCTSLAEEPLLSPEDRALFAALTESHQDFYGSGLGIACEDTLSGRLTCVGSMIRLDESRRLVQHYNIRYPITADSKPFVETVSSWAEAHGFKLLLSRDSKPNYFPKEHPAVSILTESFNTLEGKDTEPFVMGGGTYARKLPSAFAFGMGLPTDHAPQIFGPGKGECHGPDEGQYIDNLLRAIRIIIIGLLRLEEAGWQPVREGNP